MRGQPCMESLIIPIRKNNRFKSKGLTPKSSENQVLTLLEKRMGHFQDNISNNSFMGVMSKGNKKRMSCVSIQKRSKIKIS